MEIPYFFEGQYRHRENVTRWIFFVGVNIFISTFCVWPTLKMLTKNPSQNFLLCDWSMFIVDPSLAAREMRQNLLVTGGFRYNFKGSQVGFVRTVISKKQAKTWLILSTTQQVTKNCKYKNYLSLQKNIHLVTKSQEVVRYRNIPTIVKVDSRQIKLNICCNGRQP